MSRNENHEPDSTVSPSIGAPLRQRTSNLRSWIARAGEVASVPKTTLARYVVSHFIKYGDSILLGSGTTPMYLMKEILEAQRITRSSLDLAILTSNLQVVYAARDAQVEDGALFGNTQVILTGGRLNSALDSLVGDHGALAVASDLFSPRVVFFSAASFSFRDGLHIGFHFEDELSTQVALATRQTALRILLVDHTKFSSPGFFNSGLTIERLMRSADICYVLTTFSKEALSILNSEEAALSKALMDLRDRPDLIEKDFIFRVIREDGSVDHDLSLSALRSDKNLSRPTRLK